MSTPLVAAAALYALFLSAWAAARGIRGEPPGGMLPLGLVLLESVQLIQAAIVAAVLLASAQTVAEPAVLGGYLLASVALIPLSAVYDRGASGWNSFIVIVALIGLAVVDWRMTELWTEPA